MPKTERDKLFERTRAAREYTNRANQDPAVELAAFMSIFHPEHRINNMSPAELRKVVAR